VITSRSSPVSVTLARIRSRDRAINHKGERVSAASEAISVASGVISFISDAITLTSARIRSSGDVISDVFVASTTSAARFIECAAKERVKS
jgi:hypothetical protein